MPLPAHLADLDQEDLAQQRRQRTRLVLGEAGLERLARTRVLVAGLGGVGGACVEALARAGVGELVLLDCDRIEPSNLNRQLIASTRTLGQWKAEAWAERVAEIAPDCRVEALVERIEAEHAPALLARIRPDVVADCIDTVRAKAGLIQAATQRGVPVFSSLGAGNRLDPTEVRLGTLDAVRGCGLARALRQQLRRSGGLPSLTVVWSGEVARGSTQSTLTEAAISALTGHRHRAGAGQEADGTLPMADVEADSASTARVTRGKTINGTVAYLPNLFGFMLAGRIIQQLHAAWPQGMCLVERVVARTGRAGVAARSRPGLGRAGPALCPDFGTAIRAARIPLRRRPAVFLRAQRATHPPA